MAKSTMDLVKLRIDDSDVMTLREFIHVNTADDVEPLMWNEIVELGKLCVGEWIGIGFSKIERIN